MAERKARKLTEMSKPKGTTKSESVTCHLLPGTLADLDAEIAHELAGLPFAKAGRGAWIEAQVVHILAERKAAREGQAPAAAPALAPVKPVRKAS